MATTYDYIAANRRRSVLLTVVVVAFIFLLAWVLDQAFDDSVFLVFAVILSVVMTLVSYYAGDQIALRLAGAQPVTKEQAPSVVRMVENLAIADGLPMPRVYVMADPTINAFATGRSPKQASIAVTTGAIEKLENEELEGVLAHELSHVKNEDVRFMTLVAILVGVIVILADLFWRGRWLGFGGRHSESRGGGNVLQIIGILLLIFSPIIAQLIKLAVSRRREFLADASGALLTRYPEGLARALEKIETTNTQPLRSASDATAHLFFSNPFGKRSGFHTLFSTHPPIAERVKALRSMGD